jgi:ribonuclease R
VFEGTVSGVTGFGLFVALDDVYVEGLVHVTELGNDYFHHDKARHEMVGERTNKRFRLGDRLTIKVARVDLETTKMDFVMVDSASADAVDSSIGLNDDSLLKSLAGTKPPKRSARKKTVEDGENTLKLKSGPKPGNSTGPKSNRAIRRKRAGKPSTTSSPAGKSKAGKASKKKTSKKKSK